MIQLITDPAYSLEHITNVIERAAPQSVQLRDKRQGQDLREPARILREVTRRVGALLIINGNIELALECGADGVHVPLTEIETARLAFDWVSTPTHSDAEVTRAADAGATAILVSPIFDTPNKGPARGVAALRAARERFSGVIYALGGVDAARASSCKNAGADGVAVIRALLDAADPGAVARALDEPFVEV